MWRELSKPRDTSSEILEAAARSLTDFRGDFLPFVESWSHIDDIEVSEGQNLSAMAGKENKTLDGVHVLTQRKEYAINALKQMRSDLNQANVKDSLTEVQRLRWNVLDRVRREKEKKECEEEEEEKGVGGGYQSDGPPYCPSPD